MRGFLGMALALIVLDVVLEAPASRLSTVLGRPSHWLAAWMDPTVPLIPDGHLNDSSSTKAASNAGSNPGGINVPVIGKVKNPF